MNKKEQLGLVLMVIGILIDLLMVNDVFSIIGEVLSLIFHVNIDVRMLNSFLFRLIGLIIGSSILLIGGITFKKNSQ